MTGEKLGNASASGERIKAVKKIPLPAYKGYKADFEWDEDVNVFSGRVINAQVNLSFESNNIVSLDIAFRETVDDYLEWAEEDGFEPAKPNE